MTGLDAARLDFAQIQVDGIGLQVRLLQEALPLAKIQTIARTADEDLRARLHFCARTGQIWLHEHRMLLVHAEAQALLRKELIDTLGMERARGLLMRMGYASGAHDAELARNRSQDRSDVEAFMTGPQLHTLEGIVQVTPLRLELNRTSGHFHGEFLWENSWEGQWHRRYYGIHHEPVCWTQIGYACGYTSAFMGRQILYKEVECAGMGHPNCRIVGRPVEEWDDAADHLRFLTPQPIADQLIELQTQVVQLRSSIAQKDKLPADMLGDSPGFRRAFDLLRRAAVSQITVLLLGETGGCRMPVSLCCSRASVFSAVSGKCSSPTAIATRRPPSLPRSTTPRCSGRSCSAISCSARRRRPT